MGRKSVLASAFVCSLLASEPCSVGAEPLAPLAPMTPARPERSGERNEAGIEPAPFAKTPSRAVDAVILVTLDGVRWQEVFEGTEQARLERGDSVTAAPQVWPNVYRLLRDRGVALGGGAVAISASGPNYMSLPGYTEILSGHSPPACGDNECGFTTEPTIVDDVLDRGEDAAVVASWERLERAVAKEPRYALVSAGRHGGRQLGRTRFATHVAAYQNARPEPGGGDFRPDRFTAELALEVLRDRRPEFLMIGLGEPDEFAHLNDYAGYVRSLRACDAFLGELFRTLDGMGTRGERTAVFVTADHGRGKDFQNHGGGYAESARSWLFALGAGIEARGVVQLGEARHLGDIAPTMRGLLGLPVDTHPQAGHFIDEILLPRVALLP